MSNTKHFTEADIRAAWELENFLKRGAEPVAPARPFAPLPGYFLDNSNGLSHHDGEDGRSVAEFILCPPEERAFIATACNSYATETNKIEFFHLLESLKENVRLEKVNAELLEALKDLRGTIQYLAEKGYTNANSAAMQRAETAIKNAEK